MPNRGICTCCQAEVPIYASSLARKEEEDRGYDQREIDMTYGESINYLVEQHDFYGELCEGSGQIPQAVLN